MSNTNTITIYGKEMSKEEYFEYFFNVFKSIEDADDEVEEKYLVRRYEALRNLIHYHKWEADYHRYLVVNGLMR